jgi:2-polyprenyl-3-methyl-5-hydroxy-6-metoxy-1,4-benzoquinol methylase
MLDIRQIGTSSVTTGMSQTLANDTLNELYVEKSAWYFESSRPEMLRFIPDSARRFLDVGCGAGGFAKNLKGPDREVCGVELCEPAAEVARGHLDKVFTGLFGPELDLPKGYFDCIIFNDVVEHILDPVATLRYASTLLTEDGVLVASIPNVGNFPTIWRLAVKGEWEYKEHGILDKTHLRFYTRSSIVKLFEASGFEINTIEGINPFQNMHQGDDAAWRRYRLVSWLPRPGIHDMRYLQFAVRAKRKKGDAWR